MDEIPDRLGLMEQYKQLQNHKNTLTPALYKKKQQKLHQKSLSRLRELV